MLWPAQASPQSRVEKYSSSSSLQTFNFRRRRKYSFTLHRYDVNESGQLHRNQPADPWADWLPNNRSAIEPVFNGDDRSLINGDDRSLIDGDDRSLINGDDRSLIDGDDRSLINGDDRVVIDGVNRSG
ncbi:hypothetical protein PGT21_013541 [Puccinia graminis f. sp. tritici]|uniref:Uncharacterized protein n=1 Tax=Puccinia graminis f. sp. tritici TaxID=56615 RepID=A0A5B0QB38_PUCGR|nr:hypothetical protein PGT21_013541 [Puccinia graminis f. sp. tritici]